jgi:redox-sensing transcriptional repressor
LFGVRFTIEGELFSMTRQKVSQAPSIRRLPSYLNIIKSAKHSGDEYISGTVIASELNLEPIQVRKDLSITGIIGKPKKGYPVHALVESIEGFLGWNKERRAVLVGAGNLGSALMGYQEFKAHGMSIVAAYDADPTRIGSAVHGVEIRNVSLMDSEIPVLGAKMAILTVPSAHAQPTADRLIACGIESIWNFTNVKLRVPESVVVQKEDLSSGYALLCVMLQKNHREEPIDE